MVVVAETDASYHQSSGGSDLVWHLPRALGGDCWPSNKGSLAPDGATSYQGKVEVWVCPPEVNREVRRPLGQIRHSCVWGCTVGSGYDRWEEGL